MAAALFHHQWVDGPAAVDDAPEVDVDDLAKVLVVHVLKFAVHRDARVVEQVVDSSMLVEDPADQDATDTGAKRAQLLKLILIVFLSACGQLRVVGGWEHQLRRMLDLHSASRARSDENVLAVP